MQPLKLGGGDHKTGFTPLVGFHISIGSVQKRHLISSKPIGWDFQSSPKVGLMLTCKARITSRLCIFHSHSWPIISGLGRERERKRKKELLRLHWKKVLKRNCNDQNLKLLTATCQRISSEDFMEHISTHDDLSAGSFKTDPSAWHCGI